MPVIQPTPIAAAVRIPPHLLRLICDISANLLRRLHGIIEAGLSRRRPAPLGEDRSVHWHTQEHGSGAGAPA